MGWTANRRLAIKAVTSIIFFSCFIFTHLKNIIVVVTWLVGYFIDKIYIKIPKGLIHQSVRNGMGEM